MKFSNTITYNRENKPSRKITGTSKTIPDQSMPLRQLIERYQQGLPVSGSAGEPTFLSENEWAGRSIKSFDISESALMAKEAAELIEENNQKIKQETLQKQQQKQRETLKKELEKELEQKQKKLTDSQ